MKILWEVEKWFDSEDYTKISIHNYVDNFEKYSIDKDMFLFDENIVRDKLVSTLISSYFRKIEQYLMLYEQDFSFSNYNNFKEFVQVSKDDRVTYFLEWFKDDSIPTIKKFINEARKENYDLRHLYDVVKYYDFLVRNSFETQNYEATLDFLIGMIRNIMTQTKELTIREKEDSKIGLDETHDYIESVISKPYNYSINEKYLGIDLNQLLVNHWNSELKSACKQTFFMENLNN